MSILQACSSSPSYSPLEETSCEIPCWYDITPGTTTRAQVMQALTTYQIPDCEDVVLGPFSVTRCDDASVAIWFDVNDVVERISLGPDRSLTLDEVVQKYGKPDFVVIEEDAEVPEAMTTEIEVHYISRGLSMRLAKSNSDYTFTINPHDLIAHFTYQQAQADSESALALIAADHPDGQIFRWQGYGDYLHMSTE